MANILSAVYFGRARSKGAATHRCEELMVNHPPDIVMETNAAYGEIGITVPSIGTIKTPQTEQK